MTEGPPNLDESAQKILLNETQKVFTPEDNEIFLKTPSKDEVYKVLSESNVHAAPGSDGLTSLVYKEHFDIFGDSLTELVTSIHQGESLTVSQKTSMMVFGSKPKCSQSTKPSAKRKISLLNTDFKIITGIESRRFKKMTTRRMVYQLYGQKICFV